MYTVTCMVICTTIYHLNFEGGSWVVNHKNLKKSIVTLNFLGFQILWTRKTELLSSILSDSTTPASMSWRSLLEMVSVQRCSLGNPPMSLIRWNRKVTLFFPVVGTSASPPLILIMMMMKPPLVWITPYHRCLPMPVTSCVVIKWCLKTVLALRRWRPGKIAWSLGSTPPSSDPVAHTPLIHPSAYHPPQVSLLSVDLTEVCL